MSKKSDLCLVEPFSNPPNGRPAHPASGPARNEKADARKTGVESGQLAQLINNVIAMQRRMLASQLYGQKYQGDRNIVEAAGYKPTTLLGRRPLRRVAGQWVTVAVPQSGL